MKNKIDTKGLGDLTGRELTREAVRRRDKYTCQKCKRKWRRNKRKFDIHHLGGTCGKKSRKYDSVYDTDMLITYCHRCHLNLDEVREKMRRLSNPLQEAREKIMLNMRKKNYMLQEIGDIFHITREAVRQALDKIYKKYNLKKIKGRGNFARRIKNK